MDYLSLSCTGLMGSFFWVFLFLASSSSSSSESERSSLSSLSSLPEPLCSLPLAELLAESDSAYWRGKRAGRFKMAAGAPRDEQEEPPARYTL